MDIPRELIIKAETLGAICLANGDAHCAAPNAGLG